MTRWVRLTQPKSASANSTISVWVTTNESRLVYVLLPVEGAAKREWFKRLVSSCCSLSVDLTAVDKMRVEESRRPRLSRQGQIHRSVH